MKNEKRQIKIQNQFCILHCGFAFFIFIFSFVLFGGGHFTSVFAQIAQESTPSVTLSEREAQKEELRRQLAEIQEELRALEGQIQDQVQKKKGLEREVSSIENSIYKIRLQIRQLDVSISETQLASVETKEKIDELNLRIVTQKERISALLQRIAEYDDVSSLEVVLGYDTFSEFFNHVQNAEALQEGVRDQLLTLQETRTQLQQKEKELAQTLDEQEEFRRIQAFQQSDLNKKRTAQKALLRETRGEESRYRDLAAQRQKTAQEIRNQLFVLEGAGVSLSFGDAYHHASFAGNLTGVRPAFLLAVLKRESSWGANVGQCYLVDLATGLGKGKNTGALYPRTMKPTRDVEPFLQITKELGRDPYATAVSCPLSYGYGGAMGPAQFIPSTWMAYRDRAAQVLGYTPDPWAVRDAFVASAVKLAAAGAASQNTQDEWKSAMVYYAGGNWNNPAYWGYADWIMEKAEEYQEEIDILVGAN